MSAGGGWRSITDAARQVGAWSFAELACFELAGAAAAAVTPDGVACFLAAAARAHAWRAAQLAALLPVSVGLPDADACTVSPGKACDELLAALAALAPGAPDRPAGDGAAFLAALVGPFYKALLEAYETGLRSCDELADPPLAAVLRRVRADLAGRQPGGLALLRRLPLPGEGAHAAALRASAAAFSPVPAGTPARAGALSSRAS